MKVKGFHQGFIPTKLVNTRVDYKNILFDNYAHSVRISHAAGCGSRDAQCVSSTAH